ncbi:MAG: ComF family protein [Acidobacteria bacterium]|jgi:ComF family protein|nr:ComF family protein [Acidobacteriota bacterium]
MVIPLLRLAARALARGGGGCLRLARAGLYRPRCRICSCDLVQAREAILCTDCRGRIVPARGNACRVCGAFIPAGLDACGSCLLQAPPFLRHRSFAAYEGTLRQAIILYKYGEIEPLKHLLAQLCLETVRAGLAGPFDAVVPVPADRGRRHGFQPVRALGAVLARRLGIACWPRVLRKIRRTQPQVGLTRAQRLANLDGAFALAAGSRIAGKRILLIDDVTTTGTTLHRCAAVLKKGGARVTALTLAQSRL